MLLGGYVWGFKRRYKKDKLRRYFGPLSGHLPTLLDMIKEPQPKPKPFPVFAIAKFLNGFLFYFLNKDCCIRGSSVGFKFVCVYVCVLRVYFREALKTFFEDEQMWIQIHCHR